ncbi:CYTH domain-containing protein [Alteribacillus sp. HJP-4]|uniref:CYTH domain-containing protein n=1 Tax=Alteribacillus sp. HJP-4 TaxID=2775394 RepID=UPI0035CCDFDD
MGQEKEYEKKNLLTAAEFKELTFQYEVSGQDFRWQANTYFDTPSFHLKTYGAALRIREKNQTFECTLKEPADQGLLETNQLLTSDEAAQLLDNGIFPKGEVERQLHSLHVNPKELKKLGTLETNRASLPYKNGELFFDHSNYLDTEDFEIELEGPSLQEVEEMFQELLEKHEIPERKTENKIKRFFSRKQQIEQTEE